MEIPSNFDGKIKTLNIKVGDKVSEGDLILILEGVNEIKKEKVEKNLLLRKRLKKLSYRKQKFKINRFFQKKF